MNEGRWMAPVASLVMFAAGVAVGWMLRGPVAEPVADGALEAALAAQADGGPAAAASAGLIDGEAEGAGGDGTSAGGSGEGASAGSGGAPRGEGDVAVIDGEESAGGSSGASGASSAQAGGGSGETPSIDGDAGAAPPRRLNRESIQEEVRSHRDELGFCFAWQLHQHPELQGQLTIEYVIDGEGQVSEARVADDGLGDETVARCLLSVTRRMEFPPPEDGESVTVRYPFQLRPGDEEDE